MPETGNLSQDTQERLETVKTADIVIGLPGQKEMDEVPWAEIAALGERVLIAIPGDAAALKSAEIEGVNVLQYIPTSGDRLAPMALSGSFQEVFQISQNVGAKSCCVWNTSLQNLTFPILQRMLTPLKQGFDLVLPCYTELKFGALVNRSIIYPVVRALYGKKIHFSMAIDLAFSAQFVDRLLKIDPKTRRLRAQQWIATEAICEGMNICEANLPMDTPRPPESVDLSSILVMVLGRVFQDLERNTTFWQRSNPSQPVPAFGESIKRPEEEAPVDVKPMIETFQLGYRNLKEIWNVVLPPATLLDLKKLSILTNNSFRMPDELWVRIIYDFALAHRQRSINREHLLRSLTPLYLAWVASHALELKEAPRGGFQSILERLALAYEKQKPYLLSRWRWPDRFNP